MNIEESYIRGNIKKFNDRYIGNATVPWEGMAYFSDKLVLSFRFRCINDLRDPKMIKVFKFHSMIQKNGTTKQCPVIIIPHLEP